MEQIIGGYIYEKYIDKFKCTKCNSIYDSKRKINTPHSILCRKIKSKNNNNIILKEKLHENEKEFQTLILANNIKLNEYQIKKASNIEIKIIENVSEYSNKMNYFENTNSIDIEKSLNILKELENTLSFDCPSTECESNLTFIKTKMTVIQDELNINIMQNNTESEFKHNKEIEKNKK
jgi:hypothetical protein